MINPKKKTNEDAGRKYHRLLRAYEQTGTEPSGEAQKKVHQVLRAHIPQTNVHMLGILDLFDGFPEQAAQILRSEYYEVLPEIIRMLLENATEVSSQLNYYAEAALSQMRVRYREALEFQTGCPEEEAKRVQIANRLAMGMQEVLSVQKAQAQQESEENRRQSFELMEETMSRMKVGVRFTGVLAARFKGQNPLPIVVGVLEGVPKEPDTYGPSPLDVLEMDIQSQDNYYLFPKIERQDFPIYRTNPDVQRFLLAFASTLFETKYCAAGKAMGGDCEYFSFFSLLLLSQSSPIFVAEALFMHAMSLTDRRGNAVRLLSYILENHTSARISKKAEKEFAKAVLEMEVAEKYPDALKYFRKYNDTDNTVEILCQMGRKQEAVPVLQEKIERVCEEITVLEMAESSFFSEGVRNTNSRKNKEEHSRLSMQLGYLLQKLGGIKNNFEMLHDAFRMLRTKKHAREFAVYLVKEGKAEEAKQVLREYYAGEEDSEYMMAVVHLHEKEYEEAEALLKKELKKKTAEGPIREYVAEALIQVLSELNKPEEMMEAMLYALKHARACGSRFERDCCRLFTSSILFCNHRYACEAIYNMYKKLGVFAEPWVVHFAHSDTPEQYNALLSFARSLAEAEDKGPRFLSLVEKVYTGRSRGP